MTKRLSINIAAACAAMALFGCGANGGEDTPDLGRLTDGRVLPVASDTLRFVDRGLVYNGSTADYRSGDSQTIDGTASDGTTDASSGGDGAASDADTDSTNSLPAGSACTAPGQCQDGHCIDGVCCTTACDGTCSTCAGPFPGTCQPIAANTDPAGECVATNAMCNGTCDGQGGCTFPNDGSECGASCPAQFTLVKHRCAQRTCTASTAPADTQACTLASCQPTGSTAACTSGCTAGTDCQSGVCDRTTVHQTGQGQCIAAGPFLRRVPPNGSINTIGSLSGTVYLEAGQHRINQPVDFYRKAQPLTVIGDPAASVVILQDGQPMINIRPSPNAGANDNIVVQFSNVRFLGQQGDEEPLRCWQPPGQRTVASLTLKLHEVEFDNVKKALDSYRCNVEMRRSTVWANTISYGVRVHEASIFLASSMIQTNGNGTGISATAATLLLNHAIIANNLSGVSTFNSTTTIRNSILWQNGVRDIGAFSGSTFDIANTIIGQAPYAGGSNFTFNPNLDIFGKPQSNQVVDRGLPFSSFPVGPVDIDRQNRLQGSATDLGAFEIR